jgi:hypothetical protein
MVMMLERQGKAELGPAAAHTCCEYVLNSQTPSPTVAMCRALPQMECMRWRTGWTYQAT